MMRRALCPLSSSSQFGRRTGPTHRPTPQALTALTEPADAMRTILSARLAHLRVIGSLWAAGGAERALTKVRHSTPRAPLPNLLWARSAAAPTPRRAPPSHTGVGPRRAASAGRRSECEPAGAAARRRPRAPAGTPCLRVALTHPQCPARPAPARCPHARVCHRAPIHPLPRSPHRTACPRSAGSSTPAMKTTSSAGSPPPPRCSNRSRPCSEKRSRLRAPTVLTAAALGSSAEALESISRRRSGEIAASRSATACASCSRGWWRWRRGEGGRRSWRRGL